MLLRSSLLLLCSSLLLRSSSTAAAQQQHRPLARTNKHRDKQTNKQTNKHPGTTIRLTICERDAIESYEDCKVIWRNGTALEVLLSDKK